MNKQSMFFMVGLIVLFAGQGALDAMQKRDHEEIEMSGDFKESMKRLGSPTAKESDRPSPLKKKKQDEVVKEINMLASQEIQAYRQLRDNNGQSVKLFCFDTRLYVKADDPVEYDELDYHNKAREWREYELHERDGECKLCLSFIHSISRMSDCTMEKIAKALISNFYDPLGAVCLLKQLKLKTIEQGFDWQELIKSLLACGARPTKIPDHIQMYLRDKGQYVYSLLRNPSFVQLDIPLTDIRKKFPGEMLDGCTTDKGELLDDFVMKTIAKFLDAKTFLSLSSTCRHLRHLFFRFDSFAIPVQAIPSRILDANYWRFVCTSGVNKQELFSRLSAGISKFNPNIGIALCIYDYKGVVSSEVIDVLSKYPIVSLYFFGDDVHRLFPDGLTPLSRLTRLRELSFGRMHIKKLPKELFCFKELVRLVLTDNHIETIPDSIGYLKSLKFIDLRRNELSTLPETIGQLSQLRMLRLDENPLRSLPESIGGLEQLQLLVLAQGQLKTLPYSIGNLKKLQWLHASSNQIEEIPESIGNLKALKDLDLSMNCLKYLPKSMNGLSGLRVLDVSGNNFESFPEPLLHMKNLYIINLYGNMIEYVNSDDPSDDIPDQCLLHVFHKPIRPLSKESREDLAGLDVSRLITGKKAKDDEQMVVADQKPLSLSDAAYRIAILRLLAQKEEAIDSVAMASKPSSSRDIATLFEKKELTPGEAMLLHLFLRQDRSNAGFVALAKKYVPSC